jgi:hypothetical protein
LGLVLRRRHCLLLVQLRTSMGLVLLRDCCLVLVLLRRHCLWLELLILLRSRRLVLLVLLRGCLGLGQCGWLGLVLLRRVLRVVRGELLECIPVATIRWVSSSIPWLLDGGIVDLR